MLADMGCYLFEPFVNTSNFLIKLFPLLGVLVIVLDIYAGNKFWNQPYFKNIFAIFISYCITCLYNYNHNLVGNLKSLIWLVLYFFMYFVYAAGFSDKRKYYASICRIFNIIIIFNMICCIASTILLVLNIGVSNVEKKLTFGYVKEFGRLYGITNALTSSARIATLSLVLSIVVLLLKERKSRKIWKKIYVCNAFFSFIFLVSAVTRAAYLFLAVVCVVYIFGDSYAWKLQKERPFLRILKACIRSVACVMVLIIALLLGTIGCSYLPKTTKNIIPESDITTESGYHIFNVDRTTKSIIPESDVTAESGYQFNGGAFRSWLDTGHVEDILSREDNWLRMLKVHPILGIGVANEDYYKAQLSIPEKATVKTTMYQNILLYSGVLGLVVFIIANLMMFANAIRRLAVSHCTNQGRVALLLLACCLSFLVYTGIIYGNNLMPTIYWFLLGCMGVLVDDAGKITIESNEK